MARIAIDICEAKTHGHITPKIKGCMSKANEA
jgi:hypothetical protein